jgi:hypothetical protein
MEKTFQTFRYLTKNFAVVTGIGFLVILSNVAVTELIFFLTNRYNSARQVVPLTASYEVTAGIFALLTGLVLFLVTFKVALANGISRKTFLLANLPAAGLVAAAFSIFNIVIVQVHGLFWPITSISSQIYPDISWAGSLVFQFALYFLLIVAGWFIALAYYRSSKAGRWAISLSPFVLYGLLQVIDARTGGTVFGAIEAYQRVSMQVEIASVTMLAYAAILCGLVYLLVRRAPLKD